MTFELEIRLVDVQMHISGSESVSMNYTETDASSGEGSPMEQQKW